MKENINITKNSWIMCLGLVILFLIPYLIVNHLPITRTTLPFLFHENLIPFLPWTFVIYFSAFIQELIIIRCIPKPLLLKTVWVGLVTLACGLIIFILFPTRYPRELYPSDNILINLFRMIDSPANCFPSLHVTGFILFSTCFSLLKKPIILNVLIWLWTIIVIISVLTTKQHYVLDIFGGILLSIPAIIILRNIFRKYENA